MTGLDISQENLETEKRVVIEEYKQRYLNQPYGDMSMLLRALAYRVHPYRWATIGLSPDHIAGASLDEVRDFYRRFYHPSNAILSISADIPEERTIALCENGSARSRTIRNLRHRFRRNRRKPNPDGRRSNATYQPR